MTKYLDKFQSFTEYLLAALFIFGGISLIGQPPLQGAGIAVIIFGGQIALYIYTIWFTLLGVGLLYAKLWKKKILHKHVLLAMYLTTIYTATLASAIYGLSAANIADDVIVGVLSAWFWLRWKMKTEYISEKEFLKDIQELQDEN